MSNGPSIRFKGHQTGFRGYPTADEDYEMWTETTQFTWEPGRPTVIEFVAARVEPKSGYRSNAQARYRNHDQLRAHINPRGGSSYIRRSQYEILAFLNREDAEMLLIWIDSVLLGL